MSQFSDILAAVDVKLKTCSFIKDANNVVFGTDWDVQGVEDRHFPRLETIIVKPKCNGYDSQRNMEWVLRLATTGFIRTEQDKKFMNLAEAQMVTNYSKEVADKIFSFLDDKQQGNPPCRGFLYIEEFPEIYIEQEIIARTLSFAVMYGITISITDTEVL